MLGRLAVENLIVGLAIVLVSVLPRWLLPSGGTSDIPVLWPGAGVALGAVLVWGWRVLPGIMLPFAASGTGSDFPWTYWLLSPAGICAASVLARGGLSLAGFDRRLADVKDILLLAGVGIAGPMALAGFWTANCLVLSGKMTVSALPEVGAFFAAAYVGGALVAAPVVLLLASRRPAWPGGRQTGASLAALGLLGAVSWVVFSKAGSGSAGSAAYLAFPFVVWAALSGGLLAASVGVLGAALIAATFTGAGHGPFASGSALDGIFQLQAFLGIMSTSGLLIGAGADAQRRERLLQAEASTRKAELERLKAQVNPHFLFNCLTAIHSLVRTDGKAAEEGLTSLSALLRKSLDVAKHPLIPLGEELEIIRDALRLQKMRYEEGVEWSVAANDEAEKFRVPPMLLQPLVENAMKHGVSDGFGRVEVTAVVDGGDLLVKVRNTAPEGCDPANWSESVGLASVRARIEEACPTGSGVEFSKTPDGWIQALVRISKTDF